MLYWITCVVVYLNESQVHLWLPDLWSLWGKRPELFKWCVLTRLLNENSCSGVGDCPEDYEFNYLGVTLTPRLFAESVPLGQSLKVFFQFMAMSTLCRLCLVYLATAFHGQRAAPCQWGPSNPFPSHCSFTIARVLLGEHTCKVFLLYRITSVTCWHSVDVSERLCWLWADWAVRQENVLWRSALVLVTPDTELSLGVEELTTLEIPLGRFVQNVFVPKYWAVTLAMSP